VGEAVGILGNCVILAKEVAIMFLNQIFFKAKPAPFMFAVISRLETFHDPYRYGANG
jgi:hypothetical protein